MKKTSQKMTIGCVGQGWVGKHIADNFESRGFIVSRYSKEAPYNTEEAKKKIALCDVVFVAVPTPTTESGFDDRIVRSVMPLVGKGKIVVIKSSILPGTTDSIQKENPDKYIFHAPEFLTEANAVYDVANPSRNVIGIPDVSGAKKKIYIEKANELLSILPKSPHVFQTSAKEAEMIKFMSNCFLATKVIFSNIGFDMAEKLGCDYGMISEALGTDQRIGKSHLTVNHDKGRGAGGDCFIKDLAAFRKFFEKHLPKDRGTAILQALEAKNIELLAQTDKDIVLLTGVYGKDIVRNFAKKGRKQS